MGEVNLDGMHMFTDEMTLAMNNLEATGRVQQYWAMLHQGILGLEAQLGNGPLGRSFTVSYNDHAAQLVSSADSLTAAPEQAAETGRVCVRNYLTAEDQNRQGFEVG